MKIARITIINGGEVETYDNTEAAKDVIYELVTENETTAFHSSPVVDRLMTIEVL
jgi:hypothetical protein